jgi:hypothetical protein
MLLESLIKCRFRQLPALDPGTGTPFANGRVIRDLPYYAQTSCGERHACGAEGAAEQIVGQLLAWLNAPIYLSLTLHCWRARIFRFDPV